MSLYEEMMTVWEADTCKSIYTLSNVCLCGDSPRYPLNMRNFYVLACQLDEEGTGALCSSTCEIEEEHTQSPISDDSSVMEKKHRLAKTSNLAPVFGE